ncbi:LacI family DNA-binding transcriptional regulator [Brooklawnia cerclae]|uniref:DNA-binding LacI/PurR family transcriptional regulator n=1 Tax=Brooklawnia cerclae TaxID=349934 RepID=A0ABX0SEC4_9ACTN|nr:LacI family DNA-binding transcriptional regulator [Brooklawnia cerclae]NIH55673.1 DNA-binding LacI/PurR family transcriptional regulator [Brooklawnia cerclae]
MADKRPGRVTLKDVAKAAGVSIGTASDALAGRGRMTKQTRDRVAETATELGYVASALGKGLRTGRTNAIGVHHQNAVTALSTPYFRDFLAGAIAIAQHHDYDLTVLSSNWVEPRRTAPRVDGIIIIDPIGDDTRARELMTYDLPVVAGEHLPEGMPKCAVVAADHRGAVETILATVIEQGVHEPLIISPDRNSGWGDELRRVFDDWCAHNGLVGSLREVRFADRDPEAFRSWVTTELRARPGIDFILTASTAAARGALRAVADQGRVPGRDVLVACCSDDPSLLQAEPAVTAVDLPARSLGAACARWLFEMLDDPAEAANAPGALRTVPAHVSFRASTSGRTTAGSAIVRP